MSRPRVLFVGSLLATSLVVYACVGSDAPVGGGGSDAGPSADAAGPGTDSGSSGGEDAGVDANGASCGDGGVTCGTDCIDPSTSQKNCNRCGHDCGTGMCTGGVCQPVLVAGDPDAGTPPITSITTDQGDDNPKDVATHVFWSSSGTGGGVFQDNVTGGNTTMISTGTVGNVNVVVNQTNVFWYGFNPGGAPQPIFKGQVNGAGSQSNLPTESLGFIDAILYDPTSKYLYGSYTGGAGNTFGLFKCGPIDGTVVCGTNPVISYSSTTSGNLATDGTNVYVCDTPDGIIDQITLGGAGNASQFVMGLNAPNLIRVDGTNGYWSDSAAKTISRAALGSGTVKKQLASTANAASGLAADTLYVYWTETETGTVNYAPQTGAGPTTPYVTLGQAPSPMHLVRDKSFLYYSYGAAIYRVAVP